MAQRCYFCNITMFLSYPFFVNVINPFLKGRDCNTSYIQTVDVYVLMKILWEQKYPKVSILAVKVYLLYNIQWVTLSVLILFSHLH